MLTQEVDKLLILNERTISECRNSYGSCEIENIFPELFVEGEKSKPSSASAFFDAYLARENIDRQLSL